MNFACSVCGWNLWVDETAPVDSVTCAKCGQATRVPGAQPKPVTLDYAPAAKPEKPKRRKITRGLEGCRHCGTPVALDAKSCPKCGGRKPHPLAHTHTMLVIGLAAFVLSVPCVSAFSTRNGRTVDADTSRAIAAHDELLDMRLRGEVSEFDIENGEVVVPLNQWTTKSYEEKRRTASRLGRIIRDIIGRTDVTIHSSRGGPQLASWKDGMGTLVNR